MQTLGEWYLDQRLAHPDCVNLEDERVIVSAVALYRVLYMLERGKRSDRAQVAASLRSWLGLS